MNSIAFDTHAAACRFKRAQVQSLTILIFAKAFMIGLATLPAKLVH